MIGNRFVRRLGLTLLMMGVSDAACAERIYRIVDYPALQNGHALSGTITTSDDAPADGILNTVEILSWQWSVSGANAFSASSDDYIVNETITSGVGISAAAIWLPLDERTGLRLSRSDVLGDRPTEIFAHNLSWIRDSPPQMITGTRYFAGRSFGTTGQDFWSGPGVSTNEAKWDIAIAVPEPSSMTMLVVCFSGTLLCLVRHRTGH